MPKFGVQFGTGIAAFATAASAKTALRIASAAGVPVEIVEVRMTGAGSVAPADVQHICELRGLTGAGAGTLTAVTAGVDQRMYGGSANFRSTVGINASAEPTTYAAQSPCAFGFNQRGGDRWGVPQGEGYKYQNADTNLNAGVRVTSSTAGAIDGNGHFWEA